MEVNLENILSRDCSRRCREDRESSSIRRRRSRKMDRVLFTPFKEDRLGFASPPSQIPQRKRSPSPLFHAAGKAERHLLWNKQLNIVENLHQPKPQKACPESV